MNRLKRLRIPGVPALALYLATLVAEVPVVFARMPLTLLVVVAVLLIRDGNAAGSGGYMEPALIPTVWAIFALITPFGGARWWRTNLGGRAPSEREQTAYGDALDLLRAHSATPLRLPSAWFVIDTPQPDATVCGDALMLSRGLLESEFVAPVLAHELGHLVSSDAKLTAAIDRLIITPLPWRHGLERQAHTTIVRAEDRLLLGITVFGGVLWLARKLLGFTKGGFGLRILAPAWGSYWREREYAADQYAARLGQAEALADFLEVHALIHDHPVPFIWLSEHTHPASELRIDKLRRESHQTLAVAPGSDPVKAAPAGPPAAGPDGPALTEPDPSAETSLRSAGMALPTTTDKYR